MKPILFRISAAVTISFCFSVHLFSLSSDTVRYYNGTTEISATLTVPEGKQNIPAVVIIHGSGSSSRNNPWTTAYAKALSDRGIAVLHPDKRGSGSSKGSWQTASFQELAGDASAGIRFLRTIPQIDTSRVGLIAFSQGGYTASIVASTDPFNKFSIVISGGTAPLLEQTVNELELEAARAGFSINAVTAAALRSVYRRAFAFASARTGWKELQDTIAVIQKSDPLLSQGLRSVPRDSTHWAWQWIRATGNFDPMLSWRSNRSPTLFIYGGNDTQIYTKASMQRLLSLDQSVLTLMVIQFYAGNGHALFREDCMDFIQRWTADKGGN